MVFSYGNAQINISEGFEGGGLPSGWVNNGFGFFNNPGFATSGNFYASANSAIGSDKSLTTSSQTSNGNPMYVSIKVRKQPGISGFVGLYYLVGASTTLNQIALQSYGTAFSAYQTLSGTIPAGTIPSGTSIKFVIRAAGQAGTGSEFMFDDFLVITNSTLGPLITSVSNTPSTNFATIAYSLNAFNLATTSVVKYGLSSSNLSSQVAGFSASGTTLISNTVPITGLTPQTQYYYQIEATNSAGITTSSIGTFTTSSPIADYSFNNTYNNVNGNTPFSNLAGTTSFVDDRNGNPNSALQVIGNYVYGSNVALPLPSGNSVRTISMWYKSYVTGNGSSLFNYGLAQQYQNFGAYFGATGNIVFWGINYDQAFGGTYPALVWRHLVMVYDGSNVILYLDGTLINTIARPLVNTSSGGFFQLGNGTGATIDFDDLKIYNYALSQTDITNLYNFNSTTLTTPTFTQIASQCSGATFTLPTTSTNGISGTWSPAINNTATTTYTFTPTAGQNATTATMTVTIITNPNVTPNFPGFQPICSGDSFTLPTTSPNGVTGTWSPAFNNMATTTYTFVPNPGQCSINATRIVTVNPSTTTTFTQIPPICSGGNLILPSFSNENIVGTWSPAVNNTATTTYTFTPTAGQCASTATMTVTVLPSISPTFTQINPICAGATLTLPTTSNNGITGTWSPAINNTATTTYTFMPTNGQCPVTMTVAVNQNQIAQFQQIPPICAGATLAPLNTTSINFITGVWSPALNNMATTTYTFTPTDGQCATATMTIVVNPATTPIFTQVSPICSGATLTALPTVANNGGILGSWSPALNNTATTTYTYTPFGGQCATTATMTIIVNPNVTPTFATVNPICAGATLTALPTTSTNGVVGTWSPALNNTTTTTYTFTPNAGQCATTQTLTITVNTATTPTGNSTQTFVTGQTIADVLVNPTNVVWYASLSDATSNLNPLAIGTVLVNNTTYYAVNVVGNCRSSIFPVTVTVTLNASDFNSISFTIYPNPAQDILNIETVTELKSIEIYNIQGQKVLTSDNKQVYIANLSSGMYMVKIQDKENAVSTKKFVKK